MSQRCFVSTILILICSILIRVKYIEGGLDQATCPICMNALQIVDS